MRDLGCLWLAQGEQSSEEDHLRTLRIQTWWAVRPRRPRSKLRPEAIKRKLIQECANAPKTDKKY